MIRAALSGDAQVIEGFLARHPETSMFLRANLAAHGPCGGPAPDAARFWLQAERGAVAGVFALTTQGNGLMQAPQPTFDWPGLHALVQGETLQGMNGAADQVARARAAFGLAQTPAPLDRTEPLYTLMLADLVVPPGSTTLRLMSDADLPRVAAWRAAYLAEVMGSQPGAETDRQALIQAQRMVTSPHARPLAGAGGPVAMTAFNAALPDMVQVGAVFTPPGLRGQGHARRAVALHLAQARAGGIARAILFAASAPAARAYEAIGFRLAGRYHLLDFGIPVLIGPPQ